MNSKKNNKNSPVFDSAAPIIEPIPQPPMSKAKMQSGTNVNIKSNAKNKKGNDPTM